MRFKHDPLRPHPRRKKKNETPDETERRLGADLRLLMTDERYQKNDPDYRHFVQRQYRRVYDDPSGGPREGLRIGRPEVFVTDLEPFDRDRERRIRRGEEAGDDRSGQSAVETGFPSARRRQRSMTKKSELGSANTGVRRASASNDLMSDGDPDVFPPSERAMTDPDVGDRTRSTPIPGIDDVRNEEVRRRYQEFVNAREQREDDIETALWRSRKFLQMSSVAGFDEAKRAHQHYLEGSGEPLIVNSDIVRDYGPVKEAEFVILRHLGDWLKGRQSDSRFGRPWLKLADGERVVIGEESFDADRVGKLVHWETTFNGPKSELDPEFWTDARMTIASGTLQGFSQLVLERHGDRIVISGFVALRVTDRYDFREDHPLKSDVLEKHGDAKSFDLSTTVWTRPISGWMDISEPPVFVVQLSYDD